MSTTLTPENAQIEILIKESDLLARVKEQAREIAPRLQKDAVVVALLKGAFVYAADLIRELSRLEKRLCLDFMVLSSYGKGTVSSGRVQVKKDCETELAGRQVLLLDDILDSGNTLSFASEHLLKKGASQVLTAVLLDKPARRTTPFQADFVGFSIDDLFVVGYGIDFTEHFRELPDVGFVKQ